jgi:formylglycine-generating enzyme required for sulfatase activity
MRIKFFKDNVSRVLMLGLIMSLFAITACGGGGAGDGGTSGGSDNYPVLSVALNKTVISLYVSDVEQLEATIDPLYATNNDVTWESSNPVKATVSTTGLVTAKEIGTTTITVTTDDGEETAACLVNVIPPAGTNLSYSLPGGISFNMKFVPGGTFPTGTGTQTKVTDSGANPVTVSIPFWIAETEITYELWYAVRTWARANGYTFANPGREGHDGTISNPSGASPTANSQEPVTTMNWRDAIVWCNALTEYYNANNGSNPDLECVYYTNETYTAILKDSSDGVYDESVNFANGSSDMPYVKTAANGFRLPEELEWNCAARYKDGINWTAGSFASGATADYSNSTATGLVAWYNTNSGGGTHTVKSKTGYANALGVYDMSGNVFEWVFSIRSFGAGTLDRSEKGGSWSSTASYLRIGARDYDFPYDEYYYLGFRIVRTR